VVESRDGKYFLTDCTTHVRVELQGPDVAKFLGKTVEITGSSIPGATPAAGASQLVQVATMKTASKAGCAAGAPGAAGAAGHALSTGAAVAIVGGVVVGGTVIGLAAAGTFSGAAAPASAK
jgi:hypothetical protein